MTPLEALSRLRVTVVDRDTLLVDAAALTTDPRRVTVWTLRQESAGCWLHALSQDTPCSLGECLWSIAATYTEPAEAQ